MTDQALPGQGPGTTGPGPDGAGFTYQGAEPELIVVARAEARLRAGTDRVRSASGADISALNMFLSDEQLALEPLFGNEERTRSALPSPPAGPAGRGAMPDLSLFYRVRGGDDRALELTARLAALPEIETAYVKPGAVPARTAPQGTQTPAALTEEAKRLKEGAPATPDYSGRQGYLRPAPEGVDAYWSWQRPGGSGQGVTVVDVEGAWQLGHEDLADRLAGIVVGNPVQDVAWRNHGTAVLGVIGGDRDEKGITGIAPEAVTAAASFQGTGSAAAIHAAAERLSPATSCSSNSTGRDRGSTSRSATTSAATSRWSGGLTTARRSAGRARRASWSSRRRATAPRAWTTRCTSAGPTSSPSGGATPSTRRTSRPGRSSSERALPRPGPTAATTVPTARGSRSPTTGRVSTPRAGAARSPRPAVSGTGRVTSRAAPRRSPGTPTPSRAPRPPRRSWSARLPAFRASSGRHSSPR